MECLNNENDFILTFRANKKTSLLLDVDNLSWLVETKLDDFVKNKLTNENEMQLRTSEEKDSWNEIADRIKDEASGLFEIEETRNSLTNEGIELEKYLEQLREKLRSEQNVSSSINHDVNGSSQVIFLFIQFTCISSLSTESWSNGNTRPRSQMGATIRIERVR